MLRELGGVAQALEGPETTLVDADGWEGRCTRVSEDRVGVRGLEKVSVSVCVGGGVGEGGIVGLSLERERVRGKLDSAPVQIREPRRADEGKGGVLVCCGLNGVVGGGVAARGTLRGQARWGRPILAAHTYCCCCCCC